MNESLPDDAPVIFKYSASCNISFRGEEDSGYTWGEWRELSEEERTRLLKVFDTVVPAIRPRPAREVAAETGLAPARIDGILALKGVIEVSELLRALILEALLLRRGDEIKSNARE